MTAKLLKRGLTGHSRKIIIYNVRKRLQGNSYINARQAQWLHTRQSDTKVKSPETAKSTAPLLTAHQKYDNMHTQTSWEVET